MAPDDPTIHREVGIRLVTKQRVKEAIPHLEKAVSLAPSDANARLNLASLLLREGMSDQAIEHFRELVAQLIVPVHRALTALLARHCGLQAPDTDIAQLSFAIIAMAV